MRRYVFLGALVCLGLAACGVPASNGDQRETQGQHQQTDQFIQSQPPHFHSYSQWRQNLNEIEDAEATGIQTTSFMMGPAVDPDPIQTCPSIGVPIPITASLTNPHQLTWQWIGGDGGHYSDGIVDQMDPNGIYVPADSAGTFVICVQPDGSVEPSYAEGLVHTVFGPATWDYVHHQVKLTGAPTVHFSPPKSG
jgi:hypothetical protein